MWLALLTVLVATPPLVRAGEVEISDAATLNRVLDEVAEAIRIRSGEPAQVDRHAGARCDTDSDTNLVVVSALEAVASLQLTLERCGGHRTTVLLRSSEGAWSSALADAAATLFPAPAPRVDDTRTLSPPVLGASPASGVPAGALLLAGVSLSAAVAAVVFGFEHASVRASLAEPRTWDPDEYRAERDTLPGILTPTLIGVALGSAALGVVLWLARSS